MKESSVWHSDRIHREVRLVRWGHYGTPVMIFPTAGGDAEEIERFHLIGALRHLIDEGRIKVFSTDSIAGRAWLEGYPPQHCSWLQTAWDAMIYHEIVPAIQTDCMSPGIEIIAVGASIGAFSAVAALCRHPDAFKLAIGMSGTYDLEKYMRGQMNHDFYFSSPLHYLPNLQDGPQLRLLQRRFVVMPYGGGRWEDPQETWRMAHVLGARSIPNRVDPWGPDYDHDWPTWRTMLPRYLGEFA